MTPVTLRELLEVGAHFGHQTTRWNPRMRPYIFGARNGIYIIDLQKTVRLFNAAREFMREVTAKGGKILFVGTKQQAQEILAEEAAKISMPYVTKRWLGGTLTNFATIKKSIARLVDLESMKADGTFDLLAKKESVRREKDRQRLEKFLGGIKSMDRLPQAMFVVDAGHEQIAVREARKLNIPVIALVDTNSDPNGIDYVLPGNDDALRSIRYFLSRSAQAIVDGATLRKEGGIEEVEAIMATGDKVAAEILAAARAEGAAPGSGQDGEE
ncbi:MAG: 30S ribosomal protein S2 [Candidatus Tectomicrobia bacterium]|uniref:Small ribosomal subunit protein uS2 n=1 Tax=Tectimicrobiota bacterium TaxID=2528274 RepID=A0A933E9R5_UNCTE|nr:30S ribosomal protein S2 [Candidatus Tectomicrobia bacterium]